MIDCVRYGLPRANAEGWFIGHLDPSEGCSHKGPDFSLFVMIDDRSFINKTI